MANSISRRLAFVVCAVSDFTSPSGHLPCNRRTPLATETISIDHAPRGIRRLPALHSRTPSTAVVNGSDALAYHIYIYS